MSEQLQDVNAESVPPVGQPEIPSISPEQFTSIKNSLIQTLHNNYTNFINSIKNFPLSGVPMQEAFLHFDTGFLWFEKAIVTMPMPQVQVAQVPQPQAPEQSMGQPDEAIPEQKAEAAPIDAA